MSSSSQWLHYNLESILCPTTIGAFWKAYWVFATSSLSPFRTIPGNCEALEAMQSVQNGCIRHPIPHPNRSLLEGISGFVYHWLIPTPWVPAHNWCIGVLKVCALPNRSLLEGISGFCYYWLIPTLWVPAHNWCIGVLKVCALPNRSLLEGISGLWYH
jgi:hypothetical protein